MKYSRKTLGRQGEADGERPMKIIIIMTMMWMEIIMNVSL